MRYFQEQVAKHNKESIEFMRQTTSYNPRQIKLALCLAAELCVVFGMDLEEEAMQCVNDMNDEAT